MILGWRMTSSAPLIGSPGKPSLMRCLTRHSSNIREQAMQVSPVLQMVGIPSAKARDRKMLGGFREEQGCLSVCVSERQRTGKEIRDGEEGFNHIEPCRAWIKVGF